MSSSVGDDFRDCMTCKQKTLPQNSVILFTVIFKEGAVLLDLKQNISSIYLPLIMMTQNVPSLQNCWTKMKKKKKIKKAADGNDVQKCYQKTIADKHCHPSVSAQKAHYFPLIFPE